MFCLLRREIITRESSSCLIAFPAEATDRKEHTGIMRGLPDLCVEKRSWPRLMIFYYADSLRASSSTSAANMLVRRYVFSLQARARLRYSCIAIPQVVFPFISRPIHMGQITDLSNGIAGMIDDIYATESKLIAIQDRVRKIFRRRLSSSR
jgi:hypothetical protein